MFHSWILFEQKKLINMDSKKLFHYFKSMGTSLIIMVLITYGMAIQNPWIQYGSVFIVFALQMGYVVIRSIRAAPMIKSNEEEAIRAKNSKPLLKVSKQDVTKAKAGVKGVGGTGLGLKTLPMLIVPLVIFMGSGYVLRLLFPEIPPWQSFAIGFLLTMPFSMILTAKMGMRSSPIATPESYLVTRKGIVFDQMGRSFILQFPLKKVKLEKEKHFLEVEGQSSKTPMIPERVRLFNDKLNKLNTILIRFIDDTK